MKLFSSNTSWLLLATLWLVLFFSSWSKLWLIKVWELRQSGWSSKEVQLVTLHPLGEMASLIELRDYLFAQDQSDKLVIQAPVRNKLLPLANDASILRAVLYPYAVKVNPSPGKSVGVFTLGLSCQADICWEVRR